jgi:pimeloyl-ACP methyl ester carboxylesterase
LLFSVLIVVFSLYILLPAGFGVATMIPAKEPVGLPPDGFEAVTIEAEDGVTLAGWYAPPANGAAIILLHGAGSSREALRGHADMLTRHGYGVLALDLRGHGLSGGRTNRFGWESARDVQAAIEFLQKYADVNKIGGLGLSLGGEVLLGAAADYPALSAIVADGASYRSIQELTALPSERPLYRNFTARVLYATVQLLSGESPPKTLLESMLEARGTSFLLIAGGATDLELAFNELFAKTLGDRAELWVAPDSPHIGAFGQHPEAYESHVIEFFDKTLLPGSRSG